MSKQIIQTTGAPAPIGPYNQAVRSGNLLFVSGQIPMNPVTGDIVSGSVHEETHCVMNNIRAILLEAGLGFESIVKTSIFLSDMSHFKDVNEVYSQYFQSEFPARETVAVLGLPRGVNVEISVIAEY